MAGTKSTAAPALLVPRFVHCLNAMARKCGLAVDTGACDVNPCESWDKQGRRRLVVIWSGTVKQLRETGIFPKSYHFPQGERGSFRFGMWRRGRMFREGRCWRIEVDCGEIPLRLEQRGDLQIIYYEEETAFHGTRETLISAKVCKNLPIKRSNTSQDWRIDARSRSTHRFHDETYVHSIENEDVFKRRVEEQQRDERMQSQLLRTGHAADQVQHTTPDEYRELLETAARMATTLLTEITNDSLRRYRYYLSPPDVERLQHKLDEAMSIIQTSAIRERRGPDEANDHTRAMLANAEADPRFQRFLGKLNLEQRPPA